VNTARGPCLDEEALAEALRSGQLFAAGLDVYAEEPKIAPALLACDNVVLAPHLGSADRPTREAMARICVEAVLAVLAGGEPETRVA
jgi:glyoxylate reductase